MPQLPTSTAEEYGAEDEIKEYRQEEDDGDIDVVNDIKDDLIKEDGPESVSFFLVQPRAPLRSLVLHIYVCSVEVDRFVLSGTEP